MLISLRFAFISNIFLNKGIQGGGRFSRFLRFPWFSTKKKSDPKCIDDPNNESGEQHWTKLKVYVLYYPLRRVPGRPKNFVRGGVAFREISLFFYRFQESKSIIQNESITSILNIRDLIDQNWKSVLFFIPSGGCPATQKKYASICFKNVFFL